MSYSLRFRERDPVHRKETFIVTPISVSCMGRPNWSSTAIRVGHWRCSPIHRGNWLGPGEGRHERPCGGLQLRGTTDHPLRASRVPCSGALRCASRTVMAPSQSATQWQEGSGHIGEVNGFRVVIDDGIESLIRHLCGHQVQDSGRQRSRPVINVDNGAFTCGISRLLDVIPALPALSGRLGGQEGCRRRSMGPALRRGRIRRAPMAVGANAAVPGGGLARAVDRTGPPDVDPDTKEIRRSLQSIPASTWSPIAWSKSVDMSPFGHATSALGPWDSRWQRTLIRAV